MLDVHTPHKNRVYIAGPDLFYLDWPERAARFRSICSAHGLEAVLPVPDEQIAGPGITEPSSERKAIGVFSSCLNSLHASSGVIANLSPFRGTEPDSGTVVECALAFAAGLPVVGYTSSALSGQRGTRDAEGRLIAEEGGWIEQFGLSHNVMLHGVCLMILDSFETAVHSMAMIQENLRRGEDAPDLPTMRRAGK